MIQSLRVFKGKGLEIMSQQENDLSSNIDEVDLRIIQMLNADGRTPFSQIAQKLGVSTGMIRQRYHRLVQDGVLQVVAVTNPLLMGFTTMAQIGVKVDVGRLEEIAEQIASLSPGPNTAASGDTVPVDSADAGGHQAESDRPEQVPQKEIQPAEHNAP